MTPEERYADIDAKLHFAANVLQRLSLGQAGLRSLYRQGVRRMEDSFDRMDQQDALLAALTESQMRTETGLQRVEAAVERTQAQIEKTQAQLESLAATFTAYLKSRDKNGG